MRRRSGIFPWPTQFGFRALKEIKFEDFEQWLYSKEILLEERGVCTLAARIVDVAVLTVRLFALHKVSTSTNSD